MWHLKSIRSLNSRHFDDWSLTSSKEIKEANCFVYVIDHGLHINHFEFALADIEILLDDNDKSSSHATETVSLICGSTLGVFPDAQVKYISTKSKEDESESIPNAFETLLNHRLENKSIPGVVFCPWYLEKHDEYIEQLFNSIEDLNSVIVAAAGNYGLVDELKFPACRKSGKTVVVGSHDERACISLFGGKSQKKLPDIFAPGRKVKVATPRGYTINDGTTLASAIVAGACCYFSDTDDATDIVSGLYEHANSNKVSWKTEEHQFVNNRARSIFVGERLSNAVWPRALPVDDVGFIIAKSTKDYEYRFDFDVDYNPSCSFRETVKNELAKKELEKPIIPLSGGVDSEWALVACMDAGYSPRVITMRYLYEGGIVNNQDLDDSVRVCEKYDVKQELIDLDLKWFLEEGNFLPYMREYYCSSPQICCHLWMIDQFDGEFIFPGESFRIDRNIPSFPSIRYFSYDYYFFKNSRKGIGRLITTNNLVLSHALKTYKKSVTSGLNCNEKLYKDKCNFYKVGGYELLYRKRKLTGFELLKTKYLQQHRCWRYFDNRFRDIN